MCGCAFTGIDSVFYNKNVNSRFSDHSEGNPRLHLAEFPPPYELVMLTQMLVFLWKNKVSFLRDIHGDTCR